MKKTLRNFAVALTMLAAVTALPAQERFSFSNLSLGDGLSQITVICIRQDAQGYMWFGTRNGLNRYDGYGFDVYMTDPDNPASISDNHILSMEESPDGRLWIGTNHGLNRYDPRTDRFTRYYHSPGDPSSISGDIVQSLGYDSSGKLWVGTHNGLDMYDEAGDRFLRHDLGGLLADNPVYDILPRGQKLYLGTMSSGLIIYDIPTGGWEVLRHDPADPASIGHDFVRAVMIDKDDNLWAGTHHNGVSVRRAGESGFTTINTASGLTNGYVRALAQSPQGEVLVGTFDGLNVIDPSTFGIEQYRTFSSLPGELSHYSIYSIYYDRAQTLWIGSYAGGVDYYNPYGQKFRFYDPRHTDRSLLGLLGPVVETDDYLYIASEGSGILEFVKATGQFRSYLIFPDAHFSYAQNIVKTLCRDGERLLCSTNLGVIYSFDLRTKSYTLVHDTRMEDPIYYLGRNSAGELMAGGVNDPVGLIMISPGGRVTDRFPVSGREDVRFANVRCILELEPDRFLIGTRNDGLFDYNRRQASLVQYKHTPGEESGIPDNYVTFIERDSGGRIWGGTFGGGFGRFDPAAGAFRTFTMRDGLMSNHVCALVEDLYGTLWVSTVSGITHFDPVTGQSVNYRHEDGVQVNEFTPHAGRLLAGGNIIFCGNNGAVVFDPGFMYNNPFVPPVVLRSLSVGNTPVAPDDGTGILRQELNSQGQVVLRHDQTNFSVGFSALNYIHPERNQYAYMLEGFDAEWNEVGSRRIAYYTNIPPGRYRFVVRGSNNDRIWNDDGRGLDIVILPPFWRTWWAYTLYTMAVVGVVWLVVRYFTTRRRLENDIKLRQAEARAQAEFHEARDKLFTNFSHELRTPLTLIMSPLEDIIEKESAGVPESVRSSLAMMRDNARRLLRLVNNLMDFQKKEHGRLELRPAAGDFAAFARRMTGAFAEVASSRGITLDIETPEEGIPYVFDKSLMEKVFFNYLSNAFKNVPDGGRVEVRVSLVDRTALEEAAPGRAGAITGRTGAKHGRAAGLTENSGPSPDRATVDTEKAGASSGRAGTKPGITAPLTDRTATLTEKNGPSHGLAIPVTDTSITSPGPAGKLPAGTSAVPGDTGPSDKTTPALPGGDERFILMEIGDSGAGIPQDELEKIFTPFYQVAQNEHSASGTGLGLSLSKSIIELHGGVIWAESPEGSGALFRTVLPVDGAAVAAARASGAGEDGPVTVKVDSEAVQRGRAPESAVQEPGPGKRYTVLVVEDNLDIRRYIASHLGSRYRILEAANGADALEKALNHLPDLIISDVMMPRMDGMELVARLKEDIRTSHIPVIVITAKTMTDDIREGYRRGADDYITKPFNAAILTDRVANLISSREKLKALYGKRFSLESMGVEATSLDERFMNKLYGILEENISNPDFGLNDVCREVGMSRANLYRKIKAITDVSPNSFIRNFRLEMGAKMLKEARMSVSDVYVAVGFNSHAYFTNCFKALYGVSPTDYAAGKGSPSGTEPIQEGSPSSLE
ncbi:MAG: response regulator [Rikenellaceae bacterium]|nr:response regulator [Rikenellaceae bacterium]